MKQLPPRFKKAIAAIRSLESLPRYQAAFIFGSVAEGTSTAKSDLDVKVVVDEANSCTNINHPVFDDYKLDLTFRSFEQIKNDTEHDISKGERVPNLQRSIILFDKTGQLTRLKQQIRDTTARRYQASDHHFVQFMLYHANNKVERSLHDDPASSLYSMHANIGEVLKMHFSLNGKWWVSSKNILSSLDEWDKDLAQLVKKFVTAVEITEKYHHWSAIIDYIAAPLGGRQPIGEINCPCTTCRQDLQHLL